MRQVKLATFETRRLFDGKFWVKSDTHTFTDGKHEMKLELEFENIMNEEKAEKKKEKKEKANKKRQKKEKPA